MLKREESGEGRRAERQNGGNIKGRRGWMKRVARHEEER